MIPVIDRLITKTKKLPNGCIIWIACTNRKGYGYLGSGRRGEKKLLAHRVAYEFFVGPIPEGLCVLHDCPDGDNPACVNPMHLWLGTVIDNNADALAKDRVPRGERHYLAGITENDVPIIRERFANGESQESIAKDHGITQGTVSRIVAGKTWRHVT